MDSIRDELGFEYEEQYEEWKLENAGGYDD